MYVITTYRDVQLTNNGIPGVFYNGIPDWVFEEEVFEDNFALWWSPDSSKLVNMIFYFSFFLFIKYIFKK
jgi:hypothetical protein